jgi:carbonic anhydrase
MTNVAHANELHANQVLQQLQDGNRRYATSSSLYTAEPAAHAATRVREQPALALIIACSDAGVSPEVIFDQDVGTVLVLETGGNVLSDIVLGSIELMIDEFGPPYSVRT